MSLARRSFLQALTALPFAAKKMTPEEILEQTGISLLGQVPESSTHCASEPAAAALAHINLLGMPDFYERVMRRNAQTVSGLDPDIACKCWSLNVKIQEQRQRNYQRHLQNLKDWTTETVGREVFNKTFGFKWPWW